MQNISEDTIKQIKQKSNIVDIVSEHVALTKKGRNYFGVCPFHDDHAPSMSVSPDKQIYRCFSCGASGNVFTFLMEYEHISFREAVAELGNKVGISVEVGQSLKKKNIYQDTYNLYEKVVNIYHQILLRNENSWNARNYLKERGITTEAIEHFKLGFTPSKMKGLTDFLLKQQIPIETLINSSLTIKNDSNYYDRFIKRLLIPIKDNQGNYVGFGGRVIEESDHAKYMNSPESDFFRKGDILFNVYDARSSIRKKNYLILMEGYMDVIKAHCFGLENAVASMGTALTFQQVKTIRRLTDTVYVSYDGDSAGKKAAISAGKELEKSSCNVKIVMLPNNMDPDDFISNNGVEAYLNQLKYALSFHEFELLFLREQNDLSTESGKAKFLEEVVDVLKTVGTIERELQLNKLKEEFHLPQHFFDQFFQENRTQDKKYEKTFALPEPQNAYEVAERQLVAYMLYHSKAISLYERKVTSMINNEIWQLANFIYVTYTKNKTLPEISDWFTLMAEDEALVKTLNSVLKDSEVSDEVADYELEDYVRKINEYQFHHRAKELEKIIDTKPGTQESIEALQKLGKLLQKTKKHI